VVRITHSKSSLGAFTMAQNSRDNDLISFDDGYGLGLIISNPSGVSRSEIVEHLSPKAKRIACAIISRESEIRDAKTAPPSRSLKLARKK
jgi:hypothetical protein